MWRRAWARRRSSCIISAKAFGDRVILRDFDYICFEVTRMSGIVGPNGCGKSTLLQDDRRMKQNRMQGSVEVGETIRIGYFAQEEQEMDDRSESYRLCKGHCGIYQHQRGTHQCICHAGEVPI